jgi:hypothetical protein
VSARADPIVLRDVHTCAEMQAVPSASRRGLKISQRCREDKELVGTLSGSE